MSERLGTTLRRAAAALAGGAALVLGLPPGFDAGSATGIFGLINDALPWLWGVTLTGGVALSQALVWTRDRRGSHDLGIALSCLGLVMAVLLGPGDVEAALESGGTVGLLMAAAMPIGAAGLLRFAQAFPRPVQLEEIARTADLGRQNEVRFFRKLRGAEPTPTGSSPVSGGVRGLWWLMRNAWPVELAVAAFAVVGVLIGGAAATAGMATAIIACEIPALLAIMVIGGLRRELEDPAERRKMQWIGLGFGLSVTAAIAVPYGFLLLRTIGAGGEAFQSWLHTMGPFFLGVLSAPLFILGGIAVAMFRDGLFDPRLALRRTTIYGGAVTALILVFGVVEELLSGFVAPVLGLSDTFAGVIAGLTAAALFNPVRMALKRWAERDDEPLPVGAPDSTLAPGPQETTSIVAEG